MVGGVLFIANSFLDESAEFIDPGPVSKTSINIAIQALSNRIYNIICNICKTAKIGSVK